ncbi:PREDICTED: uncharacterized protein LOC109188529 [Ipomoea nil]|uniref:uncharacterized protein LOC109188529 n=1 Tax=Ipomoea nil TaxID=35883 RepID=UPI000901D817|nr:PREDICTED: uncharacterized protein LOC109188529 [Ipomoea nil]
MKPKRSVSDLARIHQDERESLGKYIARWQKEAQAVDGLNDQTALTFFIDSLRVDGHYSRLRDENPKIYAEAIQRANQLADTEEAVKQKCRQEVSSKRPRADNPPEGRAAKEAVSRVRARPIMDRLGTPAPRPMARLSTRFAPGFLHLPQFTQWRRPGSAEQQGVTKQSGTKIGDKDKQPMREEDGDQNQQHNPVINTIVGGPKGGDSARARKAHTRGPAPHRHALVIAMDIQGLVTRRVLVDTGSSVNVLYWEAFQKLGLAREQMRPVRTPLAGFTGDAVEAEGCVSLTIELGTWP